MTDEHAMSTDPQLDLDAIKKATGAAFAGPWESTWEEAATDSTGYAEFWHHVQVGNDVDADECGDFVVYRIDKSARRTDFNPNAVFIANARSWVPALVRELELERNRTAELLDALHGLKAPCEDALRHLAHDEYRTYREVWDALRKALTNGLAALAQEGNDRE